MEKITSRRNSQCLHVKKLGSSREYRYANSEFICDGIKLLDEAVKSEANVKTIFTTDESLSKPFDSAKIYLTDKDILDSISPLKNAQNVLFVCEMKERGGFTHKSGTHILLEGIQDPGNLGTIIRSAEAFGMNSVILTADCADPYNPKTIRASMGSIFRQEIYHITLEELSNVSMPIFGTSPSDDNLDIRKVNFNNSIIAIGSEGRGLSDEILALCDNTIYIPISNNCESLNAATAASIIMWEVSRCQV